MTHGTRSTQCAKPDWQIEREVSPGCFVHYAHGYWRPLIVHVWGHTIIGRRKLKRMWETTS